MAYTSNPKMPRLRIQAVNLLRQGWSIRQASRYTGFSIGAISKWFGAAQDDGRMTIPTESSRPHSWPHATSVFVENRIAELRLKHRRCAEMLQHFLRQEDIQVSLRTIKRILNLGRFNRAIQEECLYYLKQEPRIYQAAIRRYLPFYNEERPHLGLNLLTPSKCFQATA